MPDKAFPAFDLLSPGGLVNAKLPDLVVYLHGFRSSPSSVKAMKVQADFEAQGASFNLWVPQLPASPAQALALVQEEVQNRLASSPDLELAFIGSSLGGFYATVLGETYPQARVLLLNPAVKPYNDLQDQIGRQKVYFSEEEIEFIPDYLADLKSMEKTSLSDPLRYCLVAASGDEVLDFGMMVARYRGAHQLQISGSDHALSEFDQFWPIVRLFLGMK